jgi:hypothetical protein
VNITRVVQPRRRLRLIIAAVVVAIAGVLIPLSQTASAHTVGSSEPKPSIVLVHGAWADSGLGRGHPPAAS